MAHFAEVKTHNRLALVLRVVVVNNDVLLDGENNEVEQNGIDFLYQLFGNDDTNWIQTSYNGNFRGKYAGPGMVWDANKNAFYEPQPYPSWTLNEDNWEWESPIALPSDANEGDYAWDEDAYQSDVGNPKTEGWVQISEEE